MTPPPRRHRVRLLIALAAVLALIATWNIAMPAVPTADAHARTASTASVSDAASVGGCPLFPSDNTWNQDISSLPVSSKSATYIASIGASGHLHPDFGSGLYDGGPIGIPYTVVPQSQAKVPISFGYADESDPGPYPIPPNAPVEGGAQSTGDRHVLVVQSRAAPASSTRSSRATSKATAAGRRAAARSGSSPRTPCAPAAGPRRMPRGCRFCRGWCATTR